MSDLALPTRSRPELALGGRLLSDERLTRLVSKGSARAFAVLYQRHHQALYRYCRSIVRNQEDAQDALQSAMMRALEALQARERDLAVRPIARRSAVPRRAPTRGPGHARAQRPIDRGDRCGARDFARRRQAGAFR